MNTQQDMMVQIALNSWDSQIKNTNKLLAALTDEQLHNDIAPGKNSGIYLLGHLTAVHDAMLSLLGLGARLYPALEEPFIKSADKSGHEFPAVSLLRMYWNEVNNALADSFANMSSDEWLDKHTAVSDEDFAREPHRNKMNVLLSRTGHLAYHLGQMALLK